MDEINNSVRTSFVLSTRNRARFVERTLRNVREFITAADELIVVDGASTDDTAAVIEANRDLVRLFISEPDAGEAHGLNKGILASRGKYIKLLSDDDYVYPEGMRQAIDLLERYPNIDVILCGGESVEVDATTGEEKFLSFIFVPPGGHLCNVENMGLYPICGLGLIMTRRVIARMGLLETTYAAVDTEIIFRLIALQANFKYAHIHLYRHVSRGHSLSQVKGIMHRDCVRALLRYARWDKAQLHGPAVLAEALGLKGLPFGDSLGQLLYYGERLRRSRLGFLLGLLAKATNLAHAVVRRLPRRRAPTDAPAVTGDPGKWDGRLC